MDDILSYWKLIINCSFQAWKLDDSEKVFNQLMQILENMPRLKIIKKEKFYIHALATSRLLKSFDDIEIKNLNHLNIYK